MDKNSLYYIIDHLPNLRYTGGVDDVCIDNAEKELQLKFSHEYIEYLRKYGQLEAHGIELTGLSDKRMTSVVYATISLRKIGLIPSDMYVVEDLEIDGIEYLQDSVGNIYQYNGRSGISKYAESLAEYIVKSQK